MSTLKHSLLVGVCGVAAAICMAPTTATAAKIQLWGGGSSLISPYLRQSADCYGKPEPLIIRSPLQWVNIQPFNYTGTPPFDCSTQHITTKTDFWVDSAGSGVGIAGVLSHDPSSSAPNGYGDIDPNQTGEQDMPYISYGVSDAGLSHSDVNVYNLGNDDNGPNSACSVPLQGVCVVQPGETAHPPTTYPNPNEHRGALVQFPISVDPVAFAYSPVYKKVADGQGNITQYSFNIQFGHSDGSGGLRMDRATYCAIWNGVFATGGQGPITNWNDSRLKALNGGVSLQDPNDHGTFDVPLQIVGRSDSSGTTSIFTRHLAAVCSGVTGNQYADGSTTLPASLLSGASYDGNTVTGTEVLGEFTVAKGSGLVAKYVAFLDDPGANQSLTQGRLGYLGSDYVLPAVLVNGNNNYGLNSTDLQNKTGKWEAATGANALSGFGSIAPPQSDRKGHYDGTSCGGDSSRCRSHPWDWAEPISKTSPLADPSAKTAYPVIGTTNVLLYSCYQLRGGKDVAKTAVGFFNWYEKQNIVSDPVLGLLSQNGLAPLPKAWSTAISETFLSNKSGLSLDIQATGTGKCTGVEGG